MDFKKWLALGAALMLVVASLAGCAPAPEEEAPPPDDEVENGEQVLEGEAMGYNEDVPIRVQVTVVNDEITDIQILDHAETDGIADPALEQIPDAIIAEQSTDVDVVTDATDTSIGIMEAVEDALN